jgi:hypothetical protein
MAYLQPGEPGYDDKYPINNYIGETIDELRFALIKQTPTQWPILLDVMDHRLNETPFKSLREFVTTSFFKGGLGIPVERAEELFCFNASYKHLQQPLLAKLGIMEMAKAVPKLEERGKQEQLNRGKAKSVLDITENVKYNKNEVPSDQGGNSATYRLAKLKRDYPDIAQRIINGQFKTVADAERAAGVKPPKIKTYRLVLPTYNEEVAREKIKQFMAKFYQC